ncbi:unnamed protein product [Calicophoron daubneyi]|uniref:Uncharacterized protein n=1 Tax=Calicophoron daubneyi TaxID=300641 RepID=A0AAV2T645_CALDB
MEELDDILKDEGKHHSFSEAEGDIQEAGDRTDLNKYIDEILENQDTLHQSYTIATTNNQMKYFSGLWRSSSRIFQMQSAISFGHPHEKRAFFQRTAKSMR